MIELRILGTLDLRDTEDRDFGALLARPKLVALMVYLALARPRGFHSRDTLTGLFWPESGQRRARGALNQAVYELRKALGSDVIVSRGAEEVGLEHDQLWCDADAFEAAVLEVDWRGALARYDGPLLPGFHLPGCEEFSAWLDERREGLHLDALCAAREHAGRLAAAGESGEAAYWLRRALRWEPYDEDLARRLLEQLIAAGDRTGALREYASFAHRLDQDLGVEPSPAITELAEQARINGDGVASAGAAPSGASHPAPSLEGLTAVTVSEAPAVPRRRWIRTSSIAAVVLGFLAVGLWSPSGDQTPHASLDLDRRLVLVGLVDNRAGNPDLARTRWIAIDWISRELLRTGLVRVVPATTVMKRGGEGGGAGDPLAADMQLARSVGAGLILSGSLEQAGDSLRVDARIVDAGTGRYLQSIEVVGGQPEEAIQALARRATGALATVMDERFSSWTAAASTPPSYESYLSFAEGLEHYSRREYLEAAKSFRRAAAEDARFVTPLVWEVEALYNAMWQNSVHIDFAYGARADSLVARLNERRLELDPWDRAILDYVTANNRNDLPRTAAALRRMMQLAPEDRWRLELARLELWENRPRAAAGLLAGVDVERLDDRDRRLYLYAMVHADHRLGDFEAERDFAREWRERDPDAVMARVYELRALAGLGRVAELEAGLAELRKIEPARGRVFLLREIEIHGLADVAHREARRQLAEMRTVVDEHPEEMWRMEFAALLYLTGEYDQSRAQYQELLEQTPFSDNHANYLGSLGRIAARTGDVETARTYERSLTETDWSEVSYPGLDRYIAYERAQIAAVLGERDRAVGILRQTYDRGAIYGEAHIESMSPDLDLLRDHPGFRRLSAIRG